MKEKTGVWESILVQNMEIIVVDDANLLHFNRT